MCGLSAGVSGVRVRVRGAGLSAGAGYGCGEAGTRVYIFLFLLLHLCGVGLGAEKQDLGCTSFFSCFCIFVVSVQVQRSKISGVHLSFLAFTSLWRRFGCGEAGTRVYVFLFLLPHLCGAGLGAGRQELGCTSFFSCFRIFVVSVRVQRSKIMGVHLSFLAFTSL